MLRDTPASCFSGVGLLRQRMDTPLATLVSLGVNCVGTSGFDSQIRLPVEVALRPRPPVPEATASLITSTMQVCPSGCLSTTRSKAAQGYEGRRHSTTLP